MYYIYNKLSTNNARYQMQERKKFILTVTRTETKFKLNEKNIKNFITKIRNTLWSWQFECKNVIVTGRGEGFTHRLKKQSKSFFWPFYQQLAVLSTRPFRSWSWNPGICTLILEKIDRCEVIHLRFYCTIAILLKEFWNLWR